MNESHLQDRFIIPFFTSNPPKGLGYKEVSPNTVASNLIIEEDLVDFLKNSSVNRENFSKLRRKFKNEDELTKKLVSFIIDRCRNFRNMALFFKQ